MTLNENIADVSWLVQIVVLDDVMVVGWPTIVVVCGLWRCPQTLCLHTCCASAVTLLLW